MTSFSRTCYAFDTHFLRSLFATTPHEWVEKTQGTGANVFDKNILFFPFDANGQKSLFVVLGANNIRDYTRRGFKGSRPCILHLDPNNTVRGRHDHHAVGDKLRTWMNKLWRWENEEDDVMVTPFNKRSMPTVRPYGTSVLMLI